MADLRQNQGPLARKFTPRNEELLPIVTEVIEKNGIAFSREMMDASEGTGDLVDVLHFADWGDVQMALKAMGSVLLDEPKTTGIVRIMQKSNGEVLHVIHVNALPFGSAELEALKRLLHYSWEDIVYKYSGLTSGEKEAIGREEFETLKKWINDDEEGLD